LGGPRAAKKLLGRNAHPENDSTEWGGKVCKDVGRSEAADPEETEAAARQNAPAS